MIRLLIVFSLAISFSISVQSQCFNTKILQEVHSKISNDHRANNAFTYGMISYQSHEDNFYFESPQNPLFYLGYAKSLWVGATDPAGNLKVSANTFPTLAAHDFMPGPLSRDRGAPIDTFCGVYNRIWNVSEFQVLDHQAKFNLGTLTIGGIPADILEWPAIGNPNMPDFAPDFELAPFADINEDGIYNALDGDYPIALEESVDFIPHQFSFVVYHDATFHTSPTNGVGLQMEFQQMNYVVSCTEQSESEQTVFTRIKYINLSQERLENLRICLFEDNDLACNVNDYQGVDRDLNTNYFYNKDGSTFQGACHDPDVPDNNGAIRSTIHLSNTILGYRHFYNPGIGNPIIPIVDPSTSQEYYNVMNGLWRDGTPVTEGNIGYNPASTDVTNFSFPDRPTDANGWSMQTANQVIPTDARSLTTLVSGQLEPGETGVIDFADHFLYDPSRQELEVFEVWPEKIQAVKDDFQAMLDGTFNCGTSFEVCEEECVWPGDSNEDLAVTTKDFLQTGILASSNATGPARSVTATSWLGFNSEDWNTDLLGINAKYGDVNGNGVINEEDFEGIVTNFGRTRAGYVAPSERLDLESSNGLRIVLETDFVDLSTAQLSDQILATTVSLEDSAPPIHGLSFDMRFDTNMVTPFLRLDGINTQVFEYSFSHMNDMSRNSLNELEGDNKIQYAFTNFNGSNSNNGGNLLTQNLLIRNSATTSNPDGRDTMVVTFYNVCALNSNGDRIDLGAQYDTLVLANLMVDPNIVSSTKDILEQQNSFSIYPNPVANSLNVSFATRASGVLAIFNFNGQQLLSQSINNAAENKIDLSDLASGIYYVRYVDPYNRVSTKKFVKVEE